MNLPSLYVRAKSGPWTTSGRNVQWRLEIVDRTAYLFFQFTAGTWPKSSDWWYNLACWPTRRRGGLAHWGFDKLWTSARGDILLALLRCQGDFDSIVLSGISQGAALATAAHDFLTRCERHPLTTYAFAAPCFWHRLFLDDDVLLRAQSLHVVNVRGDLVALVLLAFGYRHVGNVHAYGLKCFPSWRQHTIEAYESALKGIEL